MGFAAVPTLLKVDISCVLVKIDFVSETSVNGMMSVAATVVVGTLETRDESASSGLADFTSTSGLLSGVCGGVMSSYIGLAMPNVIEPVRESLLGLLLPFVAELLLDKELSKGNLFSFWGTSSNLDGVLGNNPTPGLKSAVEGLGSVVDEEFSAALLLRFGVENVWGPNDVSA